MRCYSCGEKLNDSAKFCGACGADQSLRPEVEPLSLTPEESQVLADMESLISAAATEDAPVAESIPEPSLISEPMPELIPEPVEAPVAAPVPTPEPEPVPEPEPAPAPIPQPQPVPVAPAPQPQPVTPPTPRPQQQPQVAQPVYQTPQPTVYQQPAYQPQQPVYQPQQPVYQTQQPQPNYANPYQPGYQANPYQPAYQPQQNIQVNLSGAMPQRPAAPVYAPVQQPACQLPCDRGLLSMLLLSILTCGIYPLVVYSRISMEINMVASRNDGQRTMHYLWMCFLAPLTLMIYPIVWLHNLCNRFGGELHRRQINYKFNATSYWLWTFVYGFVGALVTGIVVGVLYAIEMEIALVIAIGSILIIASSVGPLIFVHKFLKASNLINADYNRRG